MVEKKRNQEKFLKELIDYEQQIKEAFGNSLKEIYGFPINISFTTMKEVWEHVKLTNVHLIGGNNCELSLTVYVNPLPSNINSVWIFLAIIKRGIYKRIYKINSIYIYL